jgi:hypothetical protein
MSTGHEDGLPDAVLHGLVEVLERFDRFVAH